MSSSDTTATLPLLPADVGLNFLTDMNRVPSSTSQGTADHPGLTVPSLPSGLLQQFLVLMLSDFLLAPLEY